MNKTYICAGCGIKNFNVNNVWSERTELRKGDHTRGRVFIRRHWCDECYPKRTEELERIVSGQVSLLG